MSTKHIFASSDGLVLKSLRGAVALNPTLSLHAPSKSVYVTHPAPTARVALVAGGGAGHEPAHASYTGAGMLASSVSGDIFASPSASQILTAIELALLAPSTSTSAPSTVSADWTPPRAVLLVINNYTGDRLNFGLALARARARFPRLAIDALVVADDVSLLKSPTPSLVGARGLAGNVLVCKIVGAYAATGAGLGEVKALGDAVVGALASIGVGLAHCHVPGRRIDPLEEATGEDEGAQGCEVGMGLHNEPGVRKGAFGHAQELVGEMLEMILGSRREAGFVRMGKTPEEADEVVLFVNNLGGISQLEMGAVLDEAMTQLQAINVHPSRVYASTYMTSLNAPGFSISLLNASQVRRTLALASPPINADVRALLDAPTDAYAWAGATKSWPPSSRERIGEGAETARLLRAIAPGGGSERIGKSGAGDDGAGYWRDADIDVGRVEAGIRAACASVLAAENDMTAFDTVVGDGDCGETFAAGAKAVLQALDGGELDIRRSAPAALVGQLGDICEQSMGGTIGALLAIFFTSLSTEVPTRATDAWHPAPQRALEALSAHTPARPGDRTIVDALQPFCVALARASSAEEVDGAVEEARRGAESTRGMNARLGRAVYVGSGPKGGDMPPDPGAWGIAAVLDGFWKGVRGA